MLLFPITLLIFLLFIFFLPVLFILGYFEIVTIGFEKLGISSEATLLLLFLILLGSVINIPLTRKKLVYFEQSQFFGLFRIPKIETQYIAINFGGAIIPILLSIYFLFVGWREGFELKPVLIATILMIIICKFLAKIVPNKGISLPPLMPPVLSALFALVLSPSFAAPAAFISGVLGTLIGADILNLGKVRKYSGFVSIGGAGVFDGIFLVGIFSALIASL